MKNYAPILIAIASIFSLSSHAQRGERAMPHSKAGSAQLMSDNMSNNELAVVSYHVEEKVNMAFGSNTTTYDVSSLSLVSTTDLGPNNTRTVTPKYAKSKINVTGVAVPAAASTIAMTKEMPKASLAEAASLKAMPKVDAPAKENKMKYVNIDIIDTYERVLEKGYKSSDMLIRVANSRYFKGDLTIAAKWYDQVFETIDDLETVYYFRYAQSLKAIGKLDKAKKMMAIYDFKSTEENKKP